MQEFEDPDPEDMPVDILAARMREIRWDGRSFTAPCPAHRDTNPSLHVTETAEGIALLNCFAGCNFKEVLAAVELEPRHLFPSDYALMVREYRGQQVNNRARPSASLRGSDLGAENADLRDFLRDNPATEIDVRWLARRLGLPSRSLRALEVGFDADNDAYLVPERNAKREVVGVLRRFRDDRKQSISGGRRGIIIPTGFEPDDDEVFIAEGASDTAALYGVGVNAIGRPHACASDAVFSALVELIPGNDSKVCVVADAGDAGEVGAMILACRLRKEIKGAVRWAKPAVDFKDVRDQIVAGAWGLGLREQGEQQ